MNEIVSKIFELFDYKPVENEIKIRFESILYKSQKIEDYWLVYQGSPDSLLEEGIQSNLLKNSKRLCADDALDKNINLLCLWECHNFTEENIKTAHLVEEDLYFFKKYILYYTHNEMNELYQQIKMLGINSTFRELPLKPDFFESYKSLSDFFNEGWQALLYRICIKLTFITLSQTENEQLTNLSEMIEGEVANQTLNKYENMLKQIKDIDNLDPDELLNILEKAVPHE
ncbi:ABC-three component system middle component 1 [Catenovulum adriaticum]|uniref:Uncharacterized protein n=1 Tax=Catenovulum adriaticum TaxID=2984846 RepID=A0ABY7ARV5_9ALTE|nr:ABC-three component system middle component 1 [Catenovulum sp. TS8]WAJ71993.1 hypothetical protein OLW01_14830 [Catenovulum sp. TS8]